MTGSITTRRTMRGSGSSPTAADLRSFLEGVADDTRVSIDTTAADQRDQRSTASWSLSATVEERSA